MTTASVLPVESRGRVQALHMRWEIERCTRRLMEAGTGVLPTHNTRISKRLRLIYLSAGPPQTTDLWHERRGVILRSVMVYRRACDIIHGRSTAQELTAAALAEWQDIVASLVALTDSICAVERSCG